MAKRFEKQTRFPILHMGMHLFWVAMAGLAIAMFIPAQTDELQEKIKLRSKVSVVPKPPNLWSEFKADLNKNLDDGWFFFSMFRVTGSEVNAAHERLMNLDDKWFNSYLHAIANKSIPSDPARAYIDNYLNALSQHSPDKLPELAKRIAISVTSKRIGKTLLQFTNSASYLHLIKAIEALPAEAADGGTRAAAVTNLGGFAALGARIAFDYFVAVARGDEKAARAAVVGAVTLDSLVPGLMPEYVGRLAALDAGQTTALIRTFESESVKHLLRTDRSGHAPEFENMLVRELGLTAAEAYEVSLAVSVRYRYTHQFY